MAFTCDLRKTILASATILLAPPQAYASTQLYAAASFVNTFQNQQFCVELQDEMDKLTLEERSKDWPILLRNKDITFLKWTDISPEKSMSLIENNDLQVQLEDPYLNTADFKHVHYIVEVEWERFAIPFYRLALQQGAMEVQSAGFISSGKHITIIRYGVKPQLINIHAIWDGSGSLKYYWTYFIRVPSNNLQGEIDYPVSIPEHMYYGEMVIVDGQISLFEASGKMPGELDEVFLPDSDSLVLVPACPVAFAK